MMPDTRPGPDATGFQALFATASQEFPRPDAGQKVASVSEHVSGADGLSGVGKKKVTAKTSGDSGGVLNALAAGLAMPVPDGNAEGVASPSAIDSDQTAGSAAVANVGADAPSISPGATLASAAGSLASSPGLTPASEIASADPAMLSNQDTVESPVAGNFSKPTATLTNTADSLSPSAPQISARAETRDAKSASSARRQDSPESVNTASDAGTLTMAVGGAPSTSGVSSSPPASQTIGMVGDAGTAVIDPPRAPVMASPAAGQKTDSKKIPLADDGSGAPMADSTTVANQLHSRFAVDPASADRSAREMRGNAPADPEQTGPDGSGFSGIGPNPSSAQAPMPAASQTIGSLTPHSTSPSSPVPAEHSNGPSAPQADTAPTPAPPALQTTQILQRMDRAETRIGLQSTDFGAIRLHTTVANDQVGAAISTSHPALRDALLFEAPSLEKAMARHSLRLDSLNVGGSSTNSHSNSFGSNERQQPGTRPSSTPVWPAPRSQSQSAVAVTQAVLEGSSRLDVRA